MHFVQYMEEKTTHTHTDHHTLSAIENLKKVRATTFSRRFAYNLESTKLGITNAK